MRRIFAVVAISALFAVCPAVGQSTFGSIVGVAHDMSQGSVPGASVTIRSLQDGSVRSTTSDQNGSFEFVNLKPGKYALSAQAEGFAEFQVPSAELNARQTLRIDVTFEVKSQSVTVEVAGSVAAINTENGEISDSKDNLEITELPLNNRTAPGILVSL
jgi:hypothetical protein